MVSLLISKGADIEAKTRDGLTPLHCAARSGHDQVVDLLLENKAPMRSKTKVQDFLLFFWLTVHLTVILDNDQLDTQLLYFTIHLL